MRGSDIELPDSTETNGKMNIHTHGFVIARCSIFLGFVRNCREADSSKAAARNLVVELFILRDIGPIHSLPPIKNGNYDIDQITIKLDPRIY